MSPLPKKGTHYMQVPVLFHLKKTSLLCLSLAVARHRLADLANVALEVLDLPIDNFRIRK